MFAFLRSAIHDRMRKQIFLTLAALFFAACGATVSNDRTGDGTADGGGTTGGAKTYIKLAGVAMDHPTTWPLGTDPTVGVPASGAQVALIDPVLRTQFPDDLTKSILQTKTGPATTTVGVDGKWSFSDVDVSGIQVGILAVVLDAPGTTPPKYLLNGTGVVAKPAVWADKTDATVFALPLKRVLQLDAILKLSGANALENVGFVYGWVIDSNYRPVNGAKVSLATNQTAVVYYPDALLASASHGSTGSTAWHGLFVVPTAGAPDAYTASAGSWTSIVAQAGSLPKGAFSAVLTSTSAYVDPKVNISGAILKHPAAWSGTSPEGAGAVQFTLEDVLFDTIAASTTTQSDGTWSLSAQDVSKIGAAGMALVTGSDYTDTLSPLFLNRPTGDLQGQMGFAIPTTVSQGLDLKLGFSGATALETTGYVLGVVVDSSKQPVSGLTIVNASTGATIPGIVYPKAATFGVGDNGKTDVNGAFVIPGTSALISGGPFALVAFSGSTPVAVGLTKIEQGKATATFLLPPGL